MVRSKTFYYKDSAKRARGRPTVELPDLTIYSCGYEPELKYMGSCRIHTCPANINKIKQPRNSGCVFNYLGIKPGEADIIPLAHAMDTGHNTIRRQYTSGVGSILQLFNLQNSVNELYEEHRLAKRCLNCGLRRDHGNCLNIIKCEKRQKLFHQAKRRYPLRVPELNIDQPRMMDLLYYLTKHEEKIEEFNISLKPSVIKISRKLCQPQ